MLVEKIKSTVTVNPSDFSDSRMKATKLPVSQPEERDTQF